ncbi:MAG: hypothetical protein Q9164_005932 [Protoblastenia rupestris]
MASLDASFCRSPLWRLPTEVRDMIYRLVVVAPRQGEVECNHTLKDEPPLIYCILNPALFQVCHRIRAEAQFIFYTENVFILGPLRNNTSRRFMLDIGKVRKLHVYAPDTFDIMSASIFRHRIALLDSYEMLVGNIRLFIDALPATHQLKHLLVEAYALEYDDLDGACPLGLDSESSPIHPGWIPIPATKVDVLGPLYTIRNVHSVHIHTYNPRQWPHLRNLESLMISNDTANPVRTSGSTEIIANDVYTPLDTWPLFSRDAVPPYRYTNENFQAGDRRMGLTIGTLSHPPHLTILVYIRIGKA